MAKKSFTFPKIETSGKYSTGISTHVDWEPHANIFDAGSAVVVEIELPGVKKEDISIILEKETLLIIRGIKHQPRQEEKERINYHLFEREFGSFYKRINIDFPLDSNDICSKLENGVLTIKIPQKKTGTIPNSWVSF